MQTAILLHEDSQFDQAEKMFERASRYARFLQSLVCGSYCSDEEVKTNTDMMQVISKDQLISHIFDLRVTQASNAWHLEKLDQCLNLLQGKTCFQIYSNTDFACTASLCRSIRVFFCCECCCWTPTNEHLPSPLLKQSLSILRHPLH